MRAPHAAEIVPVYQQRIRLRVPGGVEQSRAKPHSEIFIAEMRVDGNGDRSSMQNILFNGNMDNVPGASEDSIMKIEWRLPHTRITEMDI